MKIAIVCGRDIEAASNMDGGFVLIRNIVHELTRRGATINLFVPSTGEESSPHSLPGILGDGLSIIRFPVPVSEHPLVANPDEGSSYFLRRLNKGMQMAAYFQDKKLFDYDRVYIFHTTNAFGLARDGLVPSERTVLFPMMPGIFYQMFESVPSIYLETEKATFAAMQHIAVASEYERLVLETRCGVRASSLFLMRRGYDPESFTPLPRSAIRGELHILCANVIKPQKDQFFFVDLVRAAQIHFPKIIIHLVGNRGRSRENDQNYTQELERRIDLAGSRSHFVFHETLSQSKLNILMQKCDIAFYPSRTETFGKSALESVVTGLPTIVFDDVPAFCSFITDQETGFVVPRDVRHAVMALRELSTNHALYASISANGIALAKKYEWKAIIDNFLEEESRRVDSKGQY